MINLVNSIIKNLLNATAGAATKAEGNIHDDVRVALIRKKHLK